MNSFSEINIIDIDQEHMLGRVHSMISGSVVDGPGIRHVIFLQGCQFKCLYCHNRDSWDLDAGSLYKVSELVEECLAYATFMDKSSGGVTVSGGEALLQAPFVALLFKKLKRMGIHTCLDTNGYAQKQFYPDVIDDLLDHTDLVMLDIKHMDDDKHIELAGVSNKTTLKFARYLSEKNQLTRIRYVLVPGYTDDENDVRALAEFVSGLNNIQLVELLPYHRMGKKKWLELGETYPLEGVEPPSAASIARIKTILEHDYGLKVLV